MGRKYFNSWSSPPKARKFSKFSLPSQKHVPQRYTIRRPVHTNVFEPKLKYPASFKKPLRRQLPLRTRHTVEMPSATRSKAAGPVSVVPSRREKKTPSILTTTLVINPEKIERSGSTSPKRPRTDTTEDDGKVQTKRVKLDTEPKSNIVSKPDLETKPKGDSKTDETPKLPAVRSKKEIRLARKSIRKSQTTEIRRDWDRMPTGSQQGFANITGSICYRNSVVQALFHIPAFVNWIMDYLKPEHCGTETKRKNCVSCCLRQLVSEYWGGSSVAATWRTFHQILRRKGWAADVGIGHADAGEQLIWIFDAISKEVPAEVYSRLEHMFRVKSASVVTCGSCGHKSASTPGNEYILNIALQKGVKSLNGNIAKHLAAEKLDDYKCDSCKKTAGNQKAIEIKRLPELLCIQLNRIQWNGRTGQATVNQAATAIPSILDLTPHRKLPAQVTAASQEAKKVEYELLSVVKHSGSASFGHYVCAAAGPDGKWNLFDDRTVERSTVAEATAKADGFNPFIMYYQRKRT